MSIPYLVPPRAEFHAKVIDRAAAAERTDIIGVKAQIDIVIVAPGGQVAVADLHPVQLRAVEPKSRDCQTHLPRVGGQKKAPCQARERDRLGRGDERRSKGNGGS